MAALEVASDPGAGWDEAQCTAALAQLEELQAHINDLRLAIPRIVEPFQRPSNPSTFKLYAQGVLGSQNDIKSLNELWKSPETQAMFEHTRKSMAANADLSASRSIPMHGWTEREKKERDSKKSNRIESTDDNSTTLTEEDVSRIVVEFQKTHPNIKLEMQDDNRTISTQFVSGSVKLRFRIAIERDANGRPKLNAECLGATEPWLSINRCIGSRPLPNDLKTLLEMIAAYKTVNGTSCAKCGNLLDNLALTPTARRSRHAPAATETSETLWEALHESCLG